MTTKKAIRYFGQENEPPRLRTMLDSPLMCVCVCVCVCVCSGGLLVTTTNEWVNGSSEQVCIVSRGLTNTVSVAIRIQQAVWSHRRREPVDPVVYSQASLTLPAGRFHTEGGAPLRIFLIRQSSGHIRRDLCLINKAAGANPSDAPQIPQMF